LLVELTPQLEDFIGELIGISAELRALQARRHELAPLYSVKRLFVQRRAVRGINETNAEELDGPGLARDLDRLMAGFRKMATLQMSAPVRAVTDKPFPASYSDRVRKVGVVNAKNKALTAIAAALMDGPAALRDYVIDNFVVEGFTFDQVMRDDDALEAFVRKSAIGVWHASCSCRMGRADDPMAVVDAQGRVKGVQGLRVVDASIFPVVPCANTNFPVLMTAEKIADRMQTPSS